MKPFLIVLISLLISLTSYGQSISDSVLATFYNKVLENSFENGISCGNRTTFVYLIKTDFDTAKLVKQVGWLRLRFYKDDASLRGLLLRPWKRNKGRNIYKISHIAYSSDSVDINMASWLIVSVTKRNMALGMSCDGTLGYIPDARFVYNKETKIWKYISAQELIDQMLRNYTHKH
jgi:hypothetical protein